MNRDDTCWFIFGFCNTKTKTLCVLNYCENKEQRCLFPCVYCDHTRVVSPCGCWHVRDHSVSCFDGCFEAHRGWCGCESEQIDCLVLPCYCLCPIEKTEVVSVSSGNQQVDQYIKEHKVFTQKVVTVRDTLWNLRGTFRGPLEQHMTIQDITRNIAIENQKNIQAVSIASNNQVITGTTHLSHTGATPFAMNLCTVCMSDTLLVPTGVCSHQFCHGCLSKLSRCPLCRQDFEHAPLLQAVS